MPVEVVVTITGSSVEDVQGQIRSLGPAPELAAGAAVPTPAPPDAPAASSDAPAVEPTPADPSTPPAESQQPPWAPSS